MIAVLVLAGLRGALAGGYVRQYSYVSEQFFSAWDFISGEDPTHGTVQYVDQAEAEAAGLVRATADHVYMGVDMEAVLPPNSGRRAVRVQSRTAFNEGLFILQVEHVPTGCGLWPAFWMFGADPNHPWPAWGEFDIIEGVHTATRVMTTLHTSQNCRQDGVGFGIGPAVEWGVGRSGSPAVDCYVSAPEQWPNQGCTQQGPEATMGAPFNAAGGGTYAAEWDPRAGYFRTWFWPRGSEPADVASGQPDPEGWGPAFSYFRIDEGICDPAHFQQMRLVFDTTFCGDMGGPTFAGSCPQQAAQGLRCEEFVRLHPEEMTEAYWSISGLDVYLQSFALPVQQPGPSSWWNFMAVLGFLGALAGVAALYALVWIKVAKDAGENNRLTALYDQYQHMLTGAVGSLPSVPWNRLIPVDGNAWSRLALDEKEKTQEEDDAARAHPAPPTGSGAHRLGSGLSGGLQTPGVRGMRMPPVGSGRGAPGAPSQAPSSGHWHAPSRSSDMP